ncbi:MAG: hypothetical protein RIQ81_1722 [Pseudomonadota bacterium]|jgi:tetratricopeptide (TPR) repeat protein
MSPSEILVAGFERASNKEGAEKIDAWVKATNLFCEVSDSPLQDFLRAEESLNEAGASAVDMISNLAADSFGYHQEQRMLSSLRQLTELTGLAALRFTSAWLAFNMRDFEGCIEDCEKIDDFGYQIYGLMGQAYLENGQPEQGINNLKIALTMNDGDPAIWFQLAKAAFISDRPEDAWEALGRCAQLANANAEIAVLKTAIAISACECAHPKAGIWRAEAVATIRTIFPGDQNKALLVLYSARLALFSADESGFIEELKWFPETHDALDISMVTTDVSDILKKLQKKCWFKGAAELLGLLTGKRVQGSPGAGSSTPA